MIPSMEMRLNIKNPPYLAIQRINQLRNSLKSFQ